jgi:hypothetical protein
MSEKGLEFSFRHISRMALVVEEDLPFDPTDAGFLRANGVLSRPYGIANLIQEFGSFLDPDSRLTHGGFSCTLIESAGLITQRDSVHGGLFRRLDSIRSVHQKRREGWVPSRIGWTARQENRSGP